MSAKSFPLTTKARFDKLNEYFCQEVLSDKNFICTSYSRCNASTVRAGVKFYEGQLHHVGLMNPLIFAGLEKA